VLDKDHASRITGPVPSPADLSLTLPPTWTSDTLYFAADIRDQTLTNDNLPDMLENASLELGIYIPATGTTHQFSITGDVRVTDQGNPISSPTVVTGVIPGGWSVEVAISAAFLGTGDLTVDQAYPFTFGYRDDTFGRHDPAKTYMIWQGTSTSVYQPTWGTLMLGDTG
jgi:hypothetical protein